MCDYFKVAVPVRVVKPRRVRHAARVDLSRHVPATFKPYLVESCHDADGFWFWFSDDVTGGACGTSTVHEPTLAACRAAFACLELKGTK